MATISSAGIGSGLDVNSIVTQLMQIERQPLDRVNKQISTTNSQISDMGKLKSAVSALQDSAQKLTAFDAFSVFKTTSSNPEIVAASASSQASAGVYNVVVSSIARTQTLATTQTFTSRTTALAEMNSQIAFTINGEDKNVDIAAGATLNDIKDAINKADIGISATIVNSGTASAPTYKMVFMSDEPGTANALTRVDAQIGGDFSRNAGLDFIEFGLEQPEPPADQMPLMETKQAATDAAVTINGIEINSSSNTITDALEGLTLNLSKEGSSTITIARDQDAINQKVQDFVDAYNKVGSTVSSLRSGSLKGDSTLLSIQQQFASVLQTISGSQSTSSYSYLSQVGISLQKNGDLQLDKTAFAKAMSESPTNVRNLFSNDAGDGFMDRFYSTARGLQNTDGLLNTRTKGLQERVKMYQTQADTMQLRLDLREQSLRAQYTALDSTVAKMKNTSSYLSAQLANLS